MIDVEWVDAVRREFALNEPVSVERCRQGFENEVYRYKTKDEAWAVRIYKYRTMREVEFEALVLNSLELEKMSGIMVPCLQASLNGGVVAQIGTRPCVAYRWIEGTPALVFKAALIQELVRFVSDLQAATVSLAGLQMASRLNWDTGTVKEIAQTMLSKNFGNEFDLACSLDWYRRYSEQLSYEPRVIVHGDLNPTNLLLSPEGR